MTIYLDLISIIALAYQGTEIKDDYTIKGSMALEIETNKGDLTKMFPISVRIINLPF